MYLNPVARRVLGILTLVNVIFPPLWVFALVFAALALPSLPNGDPSPLMTTVLLGLMALAVLFGLFSLALQAFYFIHLLRNGVVNPALRKLLGLGLVLMPLVVVPLYYFLYVARAYPPNWAAAPSYETDDKSLAAGPAH
jgi:hypothetical protein